jgi:CelD/BcsL family acetyltransferase involved in cellulose biosynthesis
MSDAHAPLLDPRIDLDPSIWLKACGIRSWRFDHLPAGMPGFAAYETDQVSAWLLRLDEGFAAYRTAIEARSGWIRRTAAKLRRLERQFGPLRFEAHTDDPRAWNQLVAWKSAQYRRSGLVDNFSIAWVRAYLERLREATTPGLSAMMSTLYAGDRLAAVHLGMRSERVWHHYLPTYDRELATLSPGLGLLLRMAEHAPSIGIDTIDFSSGDMEYKRSASTDCIALMQGAVEPHWLRASRFQARRTVRRLRASPPILNTARHARRVGVALLNAARSGANALRP